MYCPLHGGMCAGGPSDPSTDSCAGAADGGGPSDASGGGGDGTHDGGESQSDWRNDPDGMFLAGVRAALDAAPAGASGLGPDGPSPGRVALAATRVVATLDLHSNISLRMLAATDVLVPQRTNPHVDDTQRGEEAAVILLELLASSTTSASSSSSAMAGDAPFTAAARLPLVTPAVRQLTAMGEPYGDVMRLGQSLLSTANATAAGGAEGGDGGGDGEAPASPPPVLLLHAGVAAGFAWCDTDKNGMTILVGRCRLTLCNPC